MPAAPKVTGVDCTISPSITAAIAGNPSATINGAMIAAAVPNPAAPSMNAPKHQVMMTICTRRSGLIAEKLSLMTCTAPDAFSVFRSRIAPKTINRMSKVSTSPCNDAAITRSSGTCQSHSAMAAAST